MTDTITAVVLKRKLYHRPHSFGKNRVFLLWQVIYPFFIYYPFIQGRMCSIFVENSFSYE